MEGVAGTLRTVGVRLQFSARAVKLAKSSSMNVGGWACSRPPVQEALPMPDRACLQPQSTA